mmetsp:Transcript_67118/g.120865  ORF Transcript_67118/g.120865 Transcript_67118/m.120865 type:complete len:270 (+) Transcript_67118:490-1299(+)
MHPAAQNPQATGQSSKPSNETAHRPATTPPVSPQSSLRSSARQKLALSDRQVDAPPQRQAELRKSLSVLADRVASAAISRWVDDGDLSEAPSYDEEGGGVDSPTWVSCPSSPSQSSSACVSPNARSNRSSGSRDNSRPPKMPLPFQSGAAQRRTSHGSGSGSSSTSLTAQLQAEVRRRSLSRESLDSGSLRTPRARAMGKISLSPVAEPGETPCSRESRGDRGAARAEGDSAKSGSARSGFLFSLFGRGAIPQQPPASPKAKPRRLWQT